MVTHAGFYSGQTNYLSMKVLKGEKKSKTTIYDQNCGHFSA